MPDIDFPFFWHLWLKIEVILEGILVDFDLFSIKRKKWNQCCNNLFICNKHTTWMFDHHCAKWCMSGAGLKVFLNTSGGSKMLSRTKNLSSREARGDDVFGVNHGWIPHLKQCHAAFKPKHAEYLIICQDYGLWIIGEEGWGKIFWVFLVFWGPKPYPIVSRELHFLYVTCGGFSEEILELQIKFPPGKEYMLLVCNPQAAAGETGVGIKSRQLDSSTAWALVFTDSYGKRKVAITYTFFLNWPQIKSVSHRGKD